jgi:glycine/D-amino acid oxidase-like deaminating enzyme
LIALSDRSMRTDGAGGDPAFGRGDVPVWGAIASRPPPDLSRLAGDIRVPAAVVGGGLTGLSAAYHLMLSGRECVVVEAGDIGGGASGRTAGFIVPRYKKRYVDLSRVHGEAAALKLHALAGEALETLHRIAAGCRASDAVSACGHITAAHDEGAIAGLAEEAEWLRSKLGDESLRLIGRDEMAARTGSAAYPAGLLDRNGGAVQPADLIGAMVATLLAGGVRIHARSPVTVMRQEGDEVVMETAGGRIRAGQAILATNGEGRGWPDGLDRRVLPIWTSAITTLPLPEGLAGSVLPGGQTLTDTAMLVRGFRRLPNGAVLAAGIADVASAQPSERAYRWIEHGLAEIFPALSGAQAERRWSGRIALTGDGLPRIGSVGERIHYGLGYGGRGVSLAVLLGRHLALRAAGESGDLGPIGAPLPVVRRQALRRRMMAFAIGGMRVLKTVKELPFSGPRRTGGPGRGTP